MECFNNHTGSKDGKGSNCRKCQRRLNRASTKKWKKKNPGKNAASASKYHSGKLKRTPAWLSNNQLNEIKQFYKHAEYLTHYTKTIFEVDHIVPLRGKYVSGLHVPWNLQLITAEENRRKYNKVF